MKRSLIIPVVVAGVVAAVPPAPAQSLSRQIATIRQRHAAESARRADSAKVANLRALLHRTLTVDFDGVPAEDVIEFLRTSLDVNIVVRSSDDPAGHGLDPLVPITLRGDDMPAIDVLEALVEQCSAVEPCDWQLRRDFVEIGTKERLSVAAAQEVRVYPIDALLFEPTRFDDAPPIGMEFGVLVPSDLGYYGGGGSGLGGGFGPGAGRSRAAHPGRYGPGPTAPATSPNSAEERRRRAEEIVSLIVDTIEPAAWQRNGGEWATIRYRDGMLVVRAPDYIHRRIGGYPKVAPPEPGEPKGR